MNSSARYLRQQQEMMLLGMDTDGPSCNQCGKIFESLAHDTTSVGEGEEWLRKYSKRDYLICYACADQNGEICKGCDSRLMEIAPFMTPTYNFEFELDEDYEEEHPGWDEVLENCDIVCEDCGRMEGPSHDPKLKNPKQEVLYFYDREKDVSADEKVLYSHDNGKKKKGPKATKTPAAADVGVKKNETEKKSVGLGKELSKSQLKEAKKIMKLLRKPSTKTDKTDKTEKKEAKKAKETKEKTKTKSKVTGKRKAERQDDDSDGDGDDADSGTFVKGADGLFVKKLKVKAV